MAYDFTSLNALVVDDNALICELMKTILESLGVGYVSVASDGREALQVMSGRSFDLAFIDWKMEPMDGIELTRQIRASANVSQKYIPIIMISGYVEQSRVNQAIAAGVNDFLAKPLIATTVYSRLAWLIEHPRNYIQTDTYFGPCRRRRGQPIDHMDRRVYAPQQAYVN